MITTGQVRDWLKTLDTGITDWAVGAIDMNKPEAACVYGTRPSPLQPVAIGQPSGYGIRAFTVLLRWGRSASPCEARALAVWESVRRVEGTLIDGRDCWVVARNLPIMLGKDDTGIFEATIDFDVWTRFEDTSPDGDNMGEED